MNIKIEIRDPQTSYKTVTASFEITVFDVEFRERDLMMAELERIFAEVKVFAAKTLGS